ncbi:MAG: transposase zinc-binding domain-containing protein, partial [Acidobacteria bacterium]|nr:transposase zinc-binding domain-containing protein [Acidobacteriota bacterium]
MQTSLVESAVVPEHDTRCPPPVTNHRYLDCGIFDQGVARVRCPDCRHEFLIAFSCKLRGLCPSCHQKRELLWVDWAERELLEDVPHRQVVFTIPKRLRIFFRYDRKLLGELAGCAWRALKIYFATYFDGAGATPGAAGFLQTSGELLNFHPHVHVLLTDGGFTPEGTFRPLASFHSR